jgi:amino acid permease
MIYHELKNKSLDKMWKVMLRGTVGSTILYVIAGLFGYATFAQYPIPGRNYDPYNKSVDDIMNK